MARKQLLALVAGSCLLSSSAHADGLLHKLGTFVHSTFDTAHGSLFNSTEKRAAWAALIGVPSFIAAILLNTRRSDKSGKTYNWKDLLKIWNIATPEYRKTAFEVLVGEKLKLVTKKTATTDPETNAKVQIIEKAVARAPRGLAGRIHAYIVLQIKPFFDGIKDLYDAHGHVTKWLDKGELI